MTFCGDQTLARFDPQRLVTQFEVSAQRLRPAQRLLWFLKRLFRRCVWVVASRCPPQREAKPLDRERRSPFWAINVLAERRGSLRRCSLWQTPRLGSCQAIDARSEMVNDSPRSPVLSCQGAFFRGY
ncbi:MAG: hypothetical protein CMJ59_10905 [Planctomycetaceae bacterium]|nr:hypothetical protein [Planctomycetaceae bacterium]